MKLLNKYNKLAQAIGATLAISIISATPAIANQNHSAAMSSATLQLSDDSIIDSIDQLGKLDFRVPTTHRFSTDNGVAVVFTELHQLPIVDVSVDFYAGSAFDSQIRPDGDGIANMTATMLTQGTSTLDEDAFIAKKEQLGIGLGGGVSKDGLSLSVRSLSKAQTLQDATDLFIDALTKPVFDDKILERNKSRLISSVKQQKQNPAYVASLAYTQALYGGHPYGHPATGDEASIKALRRDDLMAFKNQFLTKDNAKITITGDLSLDDAKALANRISTELPSGKSYQGSISTPAKPAPRHIHIDHDSSQTQIIIGHLTNAERTDTASRQRFSDLSLGNEILAGSDFTARLMKTIREQKGYTYGIYGGIERMQAAGSYAIRFSTNGEQARDAIFDTVAIIQDTLNNGVTHDELELVRLGNKNSFPEIFASNASIHKMTGSLAFGNYPADHLATRLDRLDRATIASVNQAFKDTIHPDDFIIITVGKSEPDLSGLFDK